MPLLLMGRLLSNGETSTEPLDSMRMHYGSSPKADVMSTMPVCGRTAVTSREPLGIIGRPWASTLVMCCPTRAGPGLLEQGHLDEAEACFREALRIDPNLAATWAGLAAPGRARRLRQVVRIRTFRPGDRAQVAGRLLSLAINLKGRLAEPELQVMEGLLDQETLADDTRASLHSASPRFSMPEVSTPAPPSLRKRPMPSGLRAGPHAESPISPIAIRGSLMP